MKYLSNVFGWIFLLLLVLDGQTIQADHHAGGQPNIVVFLVDDMGLMDTSVPFLTDSDGKPERHPLNDYYRTPSMKRLADRGTRFSQFYANSVCSPTRVSIMTGQSSARHHTTQYIKPESNNAGPLGRKEWQWKGISPTHVTLPALLAKHGYRTIHAGKGHFGPIDSFGAKPDNFGFDINIAGCSFGQPGSYYGKENFGNGIPKRQRRAVPGLSQYHGKDIFLTEALTLEMNKAITQSVQDKKPFFAYMAHYAVHAPFQSDTRFASHYDSGPGGGKKANSRPARAFATMVEGMDKSLGDMLNHLEKLGVAENTLVFFLGDNGTDAPLGATHGIACSAPLRGKKGTHYEGGMRVPFIAAWAKPNVKNPLQKKLPIPQCAIVDDIGTIHNLFPTVLAAVGLDAQQVAGKNHIIDGIDLRSSLTGNVDAAKEEPRTFLMHFPHAHRSSYFTSFRRGDLKLVYHYQRTAGKRYELFDLAKDRNESSNLAATHPKQLRELVTAMAEALTNANA